MLTAKQRELLLFIDGRLKEGGISPSFDEMRMALELKSKSGVHRLISALEERGFIRRLQAGERAHISACARAEAERLFAPTAIAKAIAEALEELAA